MATSILRREAIAIALATVLASSESALLGVPLLLQFQT